MSPPNTPVRILLVEDHSDLRRVIRILLEQDSRYEVCGEAATVPAALETALLVRPQLAIVDLSLGEGNGLDLIETLRQKLPAVPVLVMSMHSEQIYANMALNAGASGYLMKMHAAEHLHDAIDCVLGGGIWLSKLLPAVADHMASARPGPLKRAGKSEN